MMEKFRNKSMKTPFTLLTLLMATSSIAFAEGVPNEFTAGQPAVAAEVNENFTHITDRLDINETDITDLGDRVTTLEGVTDPASTTVNVNCPDDSISDAIANAPAYGELILNISGACKETVVIRRDNLALIGQGAASTSISYDVPVTTSKYRDSIINTITVISADGILIEGLTVKDAPSGSIGIAVTGGTGISMLHGSSVLIKDSIIENNHVGVDSRHSSSAQLSGTTIQNNSNYDLLIRDGSSVGIRENNTISNTNPNVTASIGIYRNGNLHISQGNNTLTHNVSDANVIEAYYNSNVRISSGTATVTGNIRSDYNSVIDIRDAVVNGNLMAIRNSIMRLRPIGDVTVNGDVSIWALGLFQVSPNVGTATINGDIICAGYNSAVFGATPDIVTGSTDRDGTCNL